MLTVMTSSGVVILELLFPSRLDADIYAVAAQTGGFISLVGTSTNRYYLPKMVVLVERRNKSAIQHLINQWSLMIGGLIFTLFLTIALFGQHPLALFGSHFSVGHMTLVIIAVGASISALYADMPCYLQYMGFNRIVLCSTLLAMLAMVTPAFLLGKSYGTPGVTIAYMMPVVFLFIGFRFMVALHFKRF